MRYAKVENNIITNIILADEIFANSIGAVLCPNNAVIGWIQVGQNFQAPPEPTIDLVKAKEEMWLKIKAESEKRIQLGGYKVGAHWYHSDTFSRTQQIGLVMLGANIPANTQWKTLDDGYITMTQSLAGQIFTAAAVSDISIFKAAQDHKDAMEALENPYTYDYSSGWPQAYFDTL